MGTSSGVAGDTAALRWWQTPCGAPAARRRSRFESGSGSCGTGRPVGRAPAHCGGSNRLLRGLLPMPVRGPAAHTGGSMRRPRMYNGQMSDLPPRSQPCLRVSTARGTSRRGPWGRRPRQGGGRRPATGSSRVNPTSGLAVVPRRRRLPVFRAVHCMRLDGAIHAFLLRLGAFPQRSVGRC